MQKYEWYVEKWQGAEFHGCTPHAMTKWEADELVKMTKHLPGNERCTFRVVHKSERTEQPNDGGNARHDKA